MGKSQNRRGVTQHRLMVYERIGQRMGTAPFLIGAMTVLLFFMGWLSTQDIVQGVDTSFLQSIWRGNIFLIVILFVCGVMWVFALVSGRFSYVEARAKFLHIQAGLLAINISYRRIKQIRLSQVGTQYPAKSVKGQDYDVIEPLLGAPCTLVDLNSWPWPGLVWLRRLWSKFMFSSDGIGLMLVVDDAMVLNQQIDSRVAVLQAQRKGQGQYLDPLARAAQIQKQSGTRR